MNEGVSLSLLGDEGENIKGVMGAQRGPPGTDLSGGPRARELLKKGIRW